MKLYNSTDKGIQVRASNSYSISIPRNGVTESFKPYQFEKRILDKYCRLYQVVFDSPDEKDYLLRHRIKFEELSSSKMIFQEPEKKVIIVKF